MEDIFRNGHINLIWQCPALKAKNVLQVHFPQRVFLGSRSSWLDDESHLWCLTKMQGR